MQWSMRWNKVSEKGMGYVVEPCSASLYVWSLPVMLLCAFTFVMLMSQCLECYDFCYEKFIWMVLLK